LGTVLLLGAMLGCGAPTQPPTRAESAPSDQAAPAAAPGRALTMVQVREPASLEPSLQPQNREWAALASGFLSYFDPQGKPVPYLAEELPSIEKGTWTILPDGRMETTYKLKKTATWQDGQPITAHDWVFGFTARTDPDFPGHSVDIERKLRRVVALDDYTLHLEWAEPYLWAGMIHLPNFPPMARHLLEPLYEQDRAAFFEGPHWQDKFVGSGPFRVVSWDPGVEIVFKAYDGFVLGKPGLDEIRVRFMGDANTIVANLLSGGLDMAFASNIGFTQAQALEGSGWSGTISYWPGNPRYLEFQGRDWEDTVRAVFDPRVRRASQYAIDRKALVDGIYAGRAPVLYFWLPPIDPLYPAVDRAVPKYEYDPRRAEALLREAGWAKGPDGRARDASGQALSIPMQVLPGELEGMEAAVVVDNWKSAGITSEFRQLSPQEWRDNELRTKFRGVAYNRRGFTLESMVWIEENLSRPERRWSGQNRSGYVNPRLDDLWARVLGAIDPKERERWLIEALTVMMEDAMVVLTHAQPDVMAHTPDLTGPAPPAAVYSSRIWNVWEWRWKA
jgi:peptide/nickel transport system substrate-binding protein